MTVLENVVTVLAAVLLLGYFAVLAYAAISAHVERKTIDQAVRTRRIKDSRSKVYYVVPWPEADEQSWVEHMKYLDEHLMPDATSLAYLSEWSEFKDAHKELVDKTVARCRIEGFR